MFENFVHLAGRKRKVFFKASISPAGKSSHHKGEHQRKRQLLLARWSSFLYIASSSPLRPFKWPGPQSWTAWLLLLVSHLASWGENSLHYWLKCQCNCWQNCVFQIQMVTEFTTFWARITKLKLRNQSGWTLAMSFVFVEVCLATTGNF